MDKQKFLGLLATIMIAAVAAFNVNLNSQEETLSDLAMENVEALAGESGLASKCGLCIPDPRYDCEIYKNGKLVEKCKDRKR